MLFVQIQATVQAPDGSTVALVTRQDTSVNPQTSSIDAEMMAAGNMAEHLSEEVVAALVKRLREQVEAE